MIRDSKEYKILVIEDNPGDFALIEDFLFEHIETPLIIHTMDHKSSKAVLLSKDHTFDVILLDLSLPDKTGEELIKSIIGLCPVAPIIVLTGYADFSFGVKSLSLGAADYMLKDELTAYSLYKSIIYSSERKKSTLALAESEKRYSDMFHFSPLPMWIADVDTLKFLDVNEATLNHYGYTRAEFLSMTLKDIRPAEDIPILERSVAEDRLISAGESKLRITVHKKKNGELINVEIQIAPFQYHGKRTNIVIANDITERLSYINAIEDQNEKLREISWIQSHIVRAPLTRIMALVPLIRTTIDNSEKEKIFDYLELSANELDEVIKAIIDKTSKADYKIAPGKSV